MQARTHARKRNEDIFQVMAFSCEKYGLQDLLAIFNCLDNLK